MSQVEIMPQAELSLESVVTDAMEGIRYQLRGALRRAGTDDLAIQFLNNALASVDTAMTDILVQANTEIDAFNALMEQLDAATIAQRLANLEVDSARAELARGTDDLREEYESKLFGAEKRRDELELIVNELNNRIENQKTALETMKVQLSGTTKEYKRVMAMEPEKKVSQLADMKKEVRQLRIDYKELGQTLRIEQSERTKASQEAQTLSLALQKMRDDNLGMAHELRRIAGVNTHQFVTKQEGGRDLLFWLRRNGFGLKNAPELRDRRLAIIENIEFNYEILSDMGFGIQVRVSEWCTPIYNNFQQYSDVAPEGIVETLEDLFEAEMATTHPQLVKRAQWTKTVLLTDVPDMPKKMPELLAGTTFVTINDVLRRDPGCLLEIKGVGNAIARLIYNACVEHVNKWEEEHGAVEAIW